MKLTTRCEYALLAMVLLTKSWKQDKYIPSGDISAKYDIPRDFLEKIVSQLSKSGLIDSKQGPNGGLKLARDPKEITLAEIIREIDGALAPVKCVSEYNYESSPLEKSKSLITLFTRIRDIQNKILENTKLSDLIS